MENITIPVPSNIARAFERADASVKQKAEIYINAWLTNFLSGKNSNERLFALMKKATEEAKSNGFTPDKLKDLLKDDE